MKRIDLITDDGFDLPAFYVPATHSSGQSLVLIQEIFGINAAMQQAAQDWACEGFDVLCPDLFARQQTDVDLDPTIPDQFQRGVSLMNGLDFDRAVRDLDAAREWFVTKGQSTKVSALGYCLGGRLAVLVALKTPIDAAVSYYGVGLEELLPTKAVTMAPCLLHIAENDSFVSEEARKTILQRAALQVNMPAYVYSGCDHAFARPGGQHFDAPAAERARARTLEFLRA